MNYGTRKRYLSMIILSILFSAFIIWWIISIPKNNIHIDQQAPLMFKNVVISAKDSHALSNFYKNVFGFKELKDNGEWAIDDLNLKSFLLRAPGYKMNGPTFKIITSNNKRPHGPLRVYDFGYAHMCFEADDVGGIVNKIISEGGSIISTFPEIEKEVCVYARDPEGNIVEVHVPTPNSITPQSIIRLLNSVIRTKFQFGPSEDSKVRFLHVNIISRDWKNISKFYQTTLNCIPVGSLRNYKDEWIANVVGEKDVHVVGQHIAVPGYSIGGPTLEIFTYNKKAKQGPLNLNDLGIVCIGYETKNLVSILQVVKSAGGRIVRYQKNSVAIIKDPDGNFLQVKQK